MHTEIYEYLMLDRKTQEIFFQSCNIGFQGQDKKTKHVVQHKLYHQLNFKISILDAVRF